MSSTTLRRLLRSVSGSCALALCVLAMQSVAPASAAVRNVANCNDSGAGSLRDAVAIAASGDTDRGSNVLNCHDDQRGPGFPRVQGAFAEIGAIEH
jgi:hypothetical protein